MQELEITDVCPLGGRILVRPDAAKDKSDSGVIIPEVAQNKPNTGEVIELGIPQRDKNNVPIPYDVAAGDKVAFGKHAGIELKLNGEIVLLMLQSEMWAIITKRSYQDDD